MYSFPDNSLADSLISNEVARVFGPASLSNLGPGFDTLGLCLDGVGDVIEARKVEGKGVEISFVETAFGAGITTDPQKNTAGIAAQLVMEQLGYKGGLSLRVDKGFKPGSGIGSSAASAVGAALATSKVLGDQLSKDDLINAVLGGEAVASGARHGDNVLPSLFGGLVLVSSDDPTIYRRVPTPGNLWIVVILPEVQVLTRQARAMLPASVELRDAINQASALAFMIDAFRAGDWLVVGQWMMQDKIAEPVRSTLVPCYNQIKNAALEAGAFGCALTGSGPAMFAISDDKTKALTIQQAMESACHSVEIACSVYLSQVNNDGARDVSNDNVDTSKDDQ